MTPAPAFDTTEQKQVARAAALCFCGRICFLRGSNVTVLHSGTTKKYSDQWGAAFGAGASKKTATASKKTAVAPKKSAKKKAKKKA
ncbi:MAG: hypothetical protein ABI614_10765 [Planctomycetota bacterium]